MKKLLLGWTRGGFNFHTKFSARDISLISALLRECNSSMPTEIHRAIRGLDTLAFWKGLEFRTFLLYVGPVVLKDFLPEDAYTHYLQLFCAIRICSSEKFFNCPEYSQVAESLLKDFVEQYIHLYGIDSIGSNVHNLCHLIEDVKRFGILPKISAYPFENMLFFVKNLLRSGKHPLSQVANRIIEMNLNQKCLHPVGIIKDLPYASKEIKGEENKFAVVQMDGFILVNNKKDKYFLTTSNEIIEMDYATIIENKIYIFGKKYKYLNPFFSSPFDSTFIKIYMSCDTIHEVGKLYWVKEISCKMIKLKYSNKNVFVPLLHSFD